MLILFYQYVTGRLESALIVRDEWLLPVVLETHLVVLETHLNEKIVAAMQGLRGSAANAFTT